MISPTAKLWALMACGYPGMASGVSGKIDSAVIFESVCVTKINSDGNFAGPMLYAFLSATSRVSILTVRKNSPVEELSVMGSASTALLVLAFVDWFQYQK